MKKLFKPLYYRIFGIRRVDVLKEAREIVLEQKKAHERSGLCRAIYEVLARNNVFPPLGVCFDSFGEYVHYFFPLFVPPSKKIKGNVFDHWWWGPYDYDSRLKFLDKLIEAYKDDKTNLYKL